MMNNTLTKLVESRVKNGFASRLDNICEYVSEEIYASTEDFCWLDEKGLRSIKIGLPEFLSLKTSAKEVVETMRSSPAVRATMDKLMLKLSIEIADTVAYSIKDNIAGLKSEIEYAKRMAKQDSVKAALLISAKKKLSAAKLSNAEKEVLGLI